MRSLTRGRVPAGVCLLALIIGLAFLTGSERYAFGVPPLGSLRQGMSDAQVRALFGRPVAVEGAVWRYTLKLGGSDRTLELSWSKGRLSSGRLDLDPPVEAIELYPEEALFHSLGPSPGNKDTAPTDWILGDSKKGHRVWLTPRGKISYWTLGPPWKHTTSDKPVTVRGALARWRKQAGVATPVAVPTPGAALSQTPQPSAAVGPTPAGTPETFPPVLR